MKRCCHSNCYFIAFYADCQNEDESKVMMNVQLQQIIRNILQWLKEMTKNAIYLAKYLGPADNY